MRLRLMLSAASLALSLTGCSETGGPQYPREPGFTPRNVFRAPAYLAPRRVVLLPSYSGLATAERRQDLDRDFAAELTAQSRFEVVPVSRNELVALCGRDQVNSTEQLPPRLLPLLRAEYAADAVLFIDITHDDPYRPISLGVRAKLVDLRGSAAILWSCDTLFNAGEPAVAASARRFQLDGGRREFPTDQDGASALLSPARFARYAAHAVFGTLPR